MNLLGTTTTTKTSTSTTTNNNNNKNINNYNKENKKSNNKKPNANYGSENSSGANTTHCSTAKNNNNNTSNNNVNTINLMPTIDSDTRIKLETLLASAGSLFSFYHFINVKNIITNPKIIFSIFYVNLDQMSKFIFILRLIFYF